MPRLSQAPYPKPFPCKPDVLRNWAIGGTKQLAQ